VRDASDRRLPDLARPVLRVLATQVELAQAAVAKVEKELTAPEIEVIGIKALSFVAYLGTSVVASIGYGRQFNTILLAASCVGRVCRFSRNRPALGSGASFSIHRLCCQLGWRDSRSSFHSALEEAKGFCNRLKAWAVWRSQLFSSAIGADPHRARPRWPVAATQTFDVSHNHPTSDYGIQRRKR